LDRAILPKRLVVRHMPDGSAMTLMATGRKGDKRAPTVAGLGGGVTTIAVAFPCRSAPSRASRVT